MPLDTSITPERIVETGRLIRPHVRHTPIVHVDLADFGLAPRQTQRRQIPGRDRRALLVEKDESLPGMAQAAQDEPRIVALGDER